MTANQEGAAVTSALAMSRRQLADWLDALPAEHFDAPSLCDGWTVTDVVAHLTDRVTFGGFIGGMLRARFDFDAMNAARARRRSSEHHYEQLISDLRHDADAGTTSFASSAIDALVDVIVHGQDIARAVGVDLATSTDAVRLALDHAATSRWYGARERLAGCEAVATDADWRHGDGDEVRGSALALLLFATGRPTTAGELASTGSALG